MSNDESPENLTQKASETESAIISPVESVIMVTISAMGDFADIVGFFGMAIPYVGLVVWGLATAFSWFIWFMILLWGLFRTKGSFVVRRILLLIAGKFVDSLTFAVLPIQTATLILTIYIDNKGHSAKLEKVLKVLESFKRFV
ncbi:MAG: hypothetical protein Q8L47_04280 [bacterium]|nr:hypothetical protein [bacterium]